MDAARKNKIVTVHEAKTHLSRFVARAAAGEKIVIARGDRPMARLMPLLPTQKDHVPDTARGEIWVADDLSQAASDDTSFALAPLMTGLLVTDVFLWRLQGSPRLSPGARALIQRGETRLLWSAASSREVAVKLAQRRLPAPAAFYLPERLAEQGLECLPVENAHALRVAELSPHHRDPFDRLLVAQAQVAQLPIISDDQ